MDKKLLLIYCWRWLVIIAQLTIPCYDVDAEKVVTIIAAYVVSVKWMHRKQHIIPQESKGKIDGFNFGMNI